MVYIDRVYTRGGDGGETSLADGTRVRKTAARIVASGAVDELNSQLGVVRALSIPGSSPQMDTLLGIIQNDLFDFGADLSVPCSSDSATPQLRITAQQCAALEVEIDRANTGLPPLTSFILPGGTLLAAELHVARTICRRAEIEVWKLAEQEFVNAWTTKYLNRLSDLLFVLARAANSTPAGEANILWVPAAGRKKVDS